MNRIVTYFRESLEELHKVRWPTRAQAVRLSAIVIGFCAVSAAFFGLMDFILSEAIRAYVSSLF